MLPADVRPLHFGARQVGAAASEHLARQILPLRALQLRHRDSTEPQFLHPVDCNVDVKWDSATVSGVFFLGFATF